MSDLPVDDGDVRKTIDSQQLRGFRQTQWAKKMLGEVCGQAWVNDCGFLSSNEMASATSMVGTNRMLCSGGDTLYEYR